MRDLELEKVTCEASSGGCDNNETVMVLTTMAFISMGTKVKTVTYLDEGDKGAAVVVSEVAKAVKCINVHVCCVLKHRHGMNQQSIG